MIEDVLSSEAQRVSKVNHSIPITAAESSQVFAEIEQVKQWQTSFGVRITVKKDLIIITGPIQGVQ